MGLIMFALRNWRFVLAGLSIIGVLGTVFYIYTKGGSDMKDKIINQAIERKIEEKERLDEIRNSAIDISDVIGRLRSATF